MLHCRLQSTTTLLLPLPLPPIRHWWFLVPGRPRANASASLRFLSSSAKSISISTHSLPVLSTNTALKEKTIQVQPRERRWRRLALRLHLQYSLLLRYRLNLVQPSSPTTRQRNYSTYPKSSASHLTAAEFVRHLTEIPTSLHREYAPLGAFKKASTAVAEARVEKDLILHTSNTYQII